jgi:hypothetical protein
MSLNLRLLQTVEVRYLYSLVTRALGTGSKTVITRYVMSVSTS